MAYRKRKVEESQIINALKSGDYTRAELCLKVGEDDSALKYTLYMMAKKGMIYPIKMNIQRGIICRWSLSYERYVNSEFYLLVEAKRKKAKEAEKIVVPEFPRQLLEMMGYNTIGKPKGGKLCSFD